jgi:hypothetical protein
METLYIVNETGDVIAWAEVTESDLEELNLEAPVKVDLFGTHYAYTQAEIDDLGWETDGAYYIATVSDPGSNTFSLTPV